MNCIFFSIFLSYFLYIRAQPSAPVARCEKSGQITDQTGVYWCGNDGKRTPVSCLAPDGNRIDIGASYWTDTAVVECQQKSSDSLQIVFVACLKNGRRVELDQSFNDGQFFYKCQRQSTDGPLQLRQTACVGNNGAEVPPGGTLTQDSFVYTCNVDSNTPVLAAGGVKAPSAAQPGPPAPTTQTPSKQLTGVGCMFNGKQYKLEDDMELSSAWYKCTTDSNGSPTTQLVGCVVNGTRYKINETWKDEFFAFRCEKMAGMVLSNTYACVERYPNGSVTEYAPGRKWIVGSGEFNKYVIHCIKQGLQLRRRGIACYYATHEGQGVLDAGCMKQVGPVRIQCRPPGLTPNVRIAITENVTPADEERFAATGLKLCESKPLESVIN